MNDMAKDGGQPEQAELRAGELPVWRKPTLNILDVETGTLTVTGPFADGNGSTS